jgi:alpha-galactosidase
MLTCFKTNSKYKYYCVKDTHKEFSMKKSKIVCIGAGSFSFGLSTLVTLLKSEPLQGSEIVLVDQNQEALDLISSLAEWLNQEWGTGKVISSFSHHHRALSGANFVISAIEVPPREQLWQQDYEITLKYGLRQPYAENGGPGGFAHAARNVLPVLDIVYDMEAKCPDAWFLNFTNPMQRICALIHRYSEIKVVGLCHQLGAAYAMAAKALAQDFGFDPGDDFVSTHSAKENHAPMSRMGTLGFEHFKIEAAGVNHFTWMLDLRHRITGEDLYPLFRKRWQVMDPHFEPLTRAVFDAFGLFPVPGDEHLCEYLPWVSDPITKPWEKYDLSLYDWQERAHNREETWTQVKDIVHRKDNPDQFASALSEGAVEIIEGILGNQDLVWEAVNIPNRSYIPNLPENAIIELPGLINAHGITGIPMGPLPDGIAEILCREISASQLCIDAVVHGDRQLAMQCLLLDPFIRDIDMAKAILDDYLTTYRVYLPQFWGDK